jgi:hypothetical protein
MTKPAELARGGLRFFRGQYPGHISSRNLMGRNRLIRPFVSHSLSLHESQRSIQHQEKRVGGDSSRLVGRCSGSLSRKQVLGDFTSHISRGKAASPDGWKVQVMDQHVQSFPGLFIAGFIVRRFGLHFRLLDALDFPEVRPNRSGLRVWRGPTGRAGNGGEDAAALPAPDAPLDEGFVSFWERRLESLGLAPRRPTRRERLPLRSLGLPEFSVPAALVFRSSSHDTGNRLALLREFLAALMVGRICFHRVVLAVGAVTRFAHGLLRSLSCCSASSGDVATMYGPSHRSRTACSSGVSFFPGCLTSTRQAQPGRPTARSGTPEPARQRSMTLHPN